MANKEIKFIGKVRKYGSTRLHIEVPKEKITQKRFKHGDEVVVKRVN